MVAPSVPTDAIDRLVELLRVSLSEPDRQADIGQQAARLWWELDDAGYCNKATPEIWEEALLDLAAWHTGDERLRLQRANVADIKRYLLTLSEQAEST